MRLLLLLLLPATGLTLAPLPVRTAEPVDRFGIRQLAPSLANGREWFARWEEPRTVGRYATDPQDPLVENNADVPLRIGRGTASLDPGVSRIYVGTPRGKDGAFTAPLWKNVEITLYARRGRSSRTPSYQAFDLAARSGHGHNDRDPCDGTSYHATARFDGIAGFKKERKILLV